MKTTTNTKARNINPMADICSKGHFNNGYNDGHGYWCTECGSSVGSFAYQQKMLREFFKSGAIASLPVIFQ